jgi:hypothetical protein
MYMGRTVRFDQVYVANLDSEPVEQEQLTGVKSILTNEIEAEEIIVSRFGISNAAPSKEFSLSNKLFMDSTGTYTVECDGFIKSTRFFADEQISIGTQNPEYAFQVNDIISDTRVFSIDTEGKDVLYVEGNTVSTNIIVKNELLTSDGNVIINGKESNAITVFTNTYSTNVLVGNELRVGDNMSFFANHASGNVLTLSGNVVISPGDLYITGNLHILGNAYVSDTATYIKNEDLVVSKSVIQMGDGNDGASETGIIMTPGNSSNVAIAFVDDGTGKDELAMFRTQDSALAGGTLSFSKIANETLNLHVYGDIYTSSNIGASNINPTHDLCVGDKFFVDTSRPEISNVLEVNGFTYTKGLKIGSLGLQVGTAVTVNPLGIANPQASVISISGNIQAKSVRTSGADGWLSGIANVAPIDTLDIGPTTALGPRITSNLYDGNTWYVYGNTYTSNLLTGVVRISEHIRVGGPGNVSDNNEYSLKSSGQLLIHANDSVVNQTANNLILRSGSDANKISEISIASSTTDPIHQNINMKTNNTSRIKITSDGKIGINNTSPQYGLTVATSIQVLHANTFTMGNVWGSTGQTSIQMRVRPEIGDAFLETHVAPGKGLKFGVSSTSVMGNPKMFLSDSGYLGIGTTSPDGSIHTNNGTVYVNDQVTNNNNFDHTTIPLVVTNRNLINSVGDAQTAMSVCRDSTSGFGAKVSLDLSRWESGGSRTRMDLKLAHANYDDVKIASFRSDGRVGIGVTEPLSILHVNSIGGYNPQNNGINVLNQISGTGKDSIITATVQTASGDAFSVFSDTNNQGWSIGLDNKSGDRDFRITNNVYAVSNIEATSIFIDGITSNVGIGTDQTLAKLHVMGDVRISDVLSFSGVQTDDGGLRHHTFLQEKRYDTDGKSELFIFKGNDGQSQEFAGPDHIRSVAGAHKFQVYDNTSGLDQGELDKIISDIAIPNVFDPTPVMEISGNRRVLIKTDDESAVASGTALYVNGDIQVPLEQRISTGGLTISSDTADTINVINSISANRDLIIRHQNTEQFRIKKTGEIGVGISSPSSNLHVYNPGTGDVNPFIIESAAPGSGSNSTIMRLYKGDGYGGIIKGYRDLDADQSGIIIGAEYDSSIIDVIKINNLGHVGIGATSPVTGLHLVNKDIRIQSTVATSNATIEFKGTSSSTSSNIYNDSRTGNVFVDPYGSTVHIKGDINVTGSLALGANFELGNQIGVNLGGIPPETNLHVRGNTIFNDNEVAYKTYSKKFTYTGIGAKNIQLVFNQYVFSCKVVAMLRKIDGGSVSDISTIVLEVQGGTSNGTLSDYDIAVGHLNIYGKQSSLYPWNPVIKTGKTGISLEPLNTLSTRDYGYDIYVELFTGHGGKLVKISRDLTNDNNLDNGTGGQTLITSFTY